MLHALRQIKKELEPEKMSAIVADVTTQRAVNFCEKFGFVTLLENPQFALLFGKSIP